MSYNKLETFFMKRLVTLTCVKSRSMWCGKASTRLSLRAVHTVQCLTHCIDDDHANFLVHVVLTSIRDISHLTSTTNLRVTATTPTCSDHGTSLGPGRGRHEARAVNALLLFTRKVLAITYLPTYAGLMTSVRHVHSIVNYSQ